MSIVQLQPELSTSAKSPVEQWLERLRELARTEQTIVDTITHDGKESVFEWAMRTKVPESLVLRTSAEVLNVTFAAELSNYEPLRTFLDKTPIAFARQHAVLGLVSREGQKHLVLGSMESWHALDTFRRHTAPGLVPLLAPREVVLEKVNLAYGQRTGQAETVISTLGPSSVLTSVEAITEREDLLDGGGRAPVIQLVNAILFEAVQEGASDVHIQPCEDRVVVRMRIDGILHDQHELPKSIQEEITSRIKVQGKMNIAEKRLPQDGRATVQVGERMIDLRIASLPSSYGERVVIRLLDKSARLYTLAEVGMDSWSLEHYSRLIHLEHGLILVTGPTGSGKSTTLYAALQAINSKDRNVVTLEDPIEYDIAGVSQTQINTKKGLTFATGLRNVLRQDPDIIMVGEIRDQETAVMGIQSALTGHLVFSTLHTNDAASAVTRLLDLGIEPYLVSSSLLAVLAQRLVRCVCKKCGVAEPMTEAQLRLLDLDPSDGNDYRVTTGKGCEDCRGTGYRGRIGIFELLVVNDSVREAIQNQANASQIREAAMRGGMRLLRADGIQKILRGQTTIEEVERVTMRTAL
ncbi:GspE/PulE family protein [Aeoliella sp. SH292]|uniref:GspE/PulE family protein n=1 Tax=Aeoliella sp. SH292 TaxID=3454464 RepID=UPI003F9CEAA8